MSKFNGCGILMHAGLIKFIVGGSGIVMLCCGLCMRDYLPFFCGIVVAFFLRDCGCRVWLFAGLILFIRGGSGILMLCCLISFGGMIFFIFRGSGIVMLCCDDFFVCICSVLY
jgi:hypothetical protein